MTKTRKTTLLFTAMLSCAVALGAPHAHADTATFVIRQQAGVFLPFKQTKRCDSWTHRDLRARLRALLERLPRVDVDGSAVTVRLGPLAVVDRNNNERLLSGGALAADHVIEQHAPHPTLVARAIGSTITIEFELERATPASLRVDFATARVAFIDPTGCTATWVGMSVRLPKETK